MFNQPEKLITDDASHKWQIYLNATDAAGIPPISNLEFIETLKQVFALSDFVAAGCTSDPAIPVDLIDSGDIARQYEKNEYHLKLGPALTAATDEETLSRLLRRYRRREMVRIAWRDLSGWADLSQTVSDLSAFADACLDHALHILYQWQCHLLGTPTAADGSKQRLVILGLGKLGARELNFSSDVDLIFAYPTAGDTRGAKNSIDNNEFFLRLCRRLIKVIGQPTADGFVFRVDTRLRPFGESGPLVMDFETMERYYQEQGREWERYALIKARAVAGDKKAGAFLLDRLNPFIYRRYLDYSVFDSLREMKQMIALEVKRKGMENNIKLGAGGIREIEFFGQIFQLIRGGVNPALQNTGILTVLKTLALERHVPPEVCEELIDAYVFLRNTENRLQSFSDQQ
ncbi:MAG: bifunctional [glutamate--ammonia ligase]-adenylyl-L-tyrosine phosphorylase/[glutamate--ammonia-ligase] adenylyltransferase, partial [Desulfobacterales bacterium]